MSDVSEEFATQGSVWRRWDPHVHLPGTVLNDQFKGSTLEQALDELASRTPAIEVVGVTDYYSTQTFRRAEAAWRAGAGDGIQLLIPNVEVRLDNATTDNHGVNVHLLCSPYEVEALDRFLGTLEFSWQERVYRADLAGLRQLGRDFRHDQSLDDVGALKVGVEQFKVNFESLRRALRTDRWAREQLLIGIAGGSGDGTSGLRAEDGSFIARRQSIEGLADLIFSSSPQQVEFWQGRGPASVSELDRLYRGAKPCLHGSDAHELGRLGVPDDDRYCWLKGDATFDTLKLACLAPESRTFIGRDAPTGGFLHGRVVRVGVSNRDWFVQASLPVNPGLVAIIGARGSGKTALADLIAAAAGATEPFDNPSSFIRRADRLLLNTSATVEWSQGDVSTCDLGLGPTDQILRPVRYLSQQFVERLCASHGMSDELLAEIERVVFEAWPVGERQEATTFSELLDLRLGSAKERQQAELDAVIDLSDRITEARRLRRSLPDLEKHRAAEQVSLDQIDAKVSELTKNSDPGSSSRLQLVTEVLQRREQEVQRLDRRAGAIEALRARVRSARTTSFPAFTEKLQLEHVDAALAGPAWDAFRVDFVGEVDITLDEALASARGAHGALVGAPTSATNFDHMGEAELRTRTTSELSAERNRLQALVGLDEARTNQLRTLSDAAGEARGRITRLDGEIERAQTADSEPLVQRRLEHYRAYFDALLEEERELRELYRPLDAVISEFGLSMSKLKFSVHREVDVESWASRGEDLIDLRREGRFRGAGELEAVAAQTLLPAWETGDAEAAAEAIHGFVREHSEGLRLQRLVRGNHPDAAVEWERDVSRWLYSTDHIRLRYNLDYDGLSIERLSPGTRGIVLLLLYLAIDREESDPLIIDQPEENLDPESVYSELVRLFRSASQRRQIIMVTHNANLVVNTDVDQVIVAHCGSLDDGRLPELRYQAGGLENPSIRRAVCEVLEGGAEAFRQRARRLGLDLALVDEEDR